MELACLSSGVGSGVETRLQDLTHWEPVISSLVAADSGDTGPDGH
jgi:hypothetical protein